MADVLKYKLLRRRLSISAPRMTVRRHIPWSLKAAAGVLILAVSVVLGMWIYQEGKSFAGFGEDLRSEVHRLRDQNAALAVEKDRLAAAASSAESRLNIERSSQETLGNQIKSLELDNAKLKDDVAFFENLSASGPVDGLAIKRLQIEKDSVPQQMHYRLLVIQGGHVDHDFNGELQLIVTLQQGGKAVIMNFPDATPGTDAKAFQVNFRFFKRIEGNFRVPPGASVKQFEARVLEKGTVRAQRAVTVS
jgi:hypothetical protein